jgi:hypothetical protein
LCRYQVNSNSAALFVVCLLAASFEQRLGIEVGAGGKIRPRQRRDTPAQKLYEIPRPLPTQQQK